MFPWFRNSLALFISVSCLIFACSPARAACTNPARPEGAIFYNVDHKLFQYCDGTQWVRMHDLEGTGSGGCSAPVRSEGAMIYNTDHRVMQGCTGNIWQPMGQIGGKGEWAQISAGATSHTCGIKKDGIAWCWGNDASGQIGDGATTGPQFSPVAVSGGGTWKAIAASTSQHACAIKSDDTIWCWGRSNFGQTGSAGGNKNVPTAITAGGTWKKISAGFEHTCAIKSDDTGWCWGEGTGGKLGNGATSNSTNPVAVSGGGTWKLVSAGNLFSCGIKSDDSAWCWGANDYGELGDGTTTPSSVPVAVSGGATWKAIAAGGNHACGIKSNDTLWCWGNNFSGALGTGGAPPDPTVPTQVSGGGAWIAVDAADQLSCAIKSGGTAWCWGLDTDGALGIGGTGNKNVPTQITGTGPWISISAGGVASSRWGACALKDGGTAWCWGDNTYGQLGNGGTVDSNKAVLLGVKREEPLSGLISRWKLNEASGGTTAADSVGGYTGTLTNFTFTPAGAVLGGGLTFSSAGSNYVDVGDQSAHG